MKKNIKINVWGAIASLVVVFFFFSCEPGNTPGDPSDPDDPTPAALVLPVVTIGSAENVTDRTAVLIGWVKPNEKDTKVYFEYKVSTESNFHQKLVSGSYTGTDSIKITLDLSDLTANAEYSFKFTATNAAGKVSSNESKFSTYVVRDYDGNLYHVIKIGNQYWLQENLKTSHYADGTVIPNVTDGEAWTSLRTPGYCWYNNDSELGKVYGGLYNWYTISSPKVLIAGYHVPSDNEFTTLVNYLGGFEKATEKMKDASGKYWDLGYGEKEPNNSSGFTALPAGSRYTNGGTATFGELRINNFIFTSTIGEEIGGCFSVNGGLCGVLKNWGISIRLIKD